MKLIKNIVLTTAICFVNYLTVTFLIGLPVQIKILFPRGKHDFNNSRSLAAFESKAATSAVVVRHSINDLQFLLTVHLER